MGRRLFLAGAGLAAVALTVVLFADLLDANTVYYLEPREAVAQRDDLADSSFRLGGVVVADSVTDGGDELTFTVTDYAEEIVVRTSATPPELFAEGVPVIVDGLFVGDEFHADEVILRHEEEYDVPEDAELP